MICAHMSNYRTTTVRLVNTCQKTNANPYLKVQKPKTNPPSRTPVHVENNTATARAAAVTGMNARPP